MLQHLIETPVPQAIRGLGYLPAPTCLRACLRAARKQAYTNRQRLRQAGGTRLIPDARYSERVRTVTIDQYATFN